jgi:tetratricopeptide (TPR) repeat protein
MSRLGYYLALWGAPEQGDEALELLGRAAALSPDDAEIQGNYGWGAHRRGAGEASARALEAAVRLDGMDPTNHFRLAQALADGGEVQRALEEARIAIAASPAAEWVADARALIARLERAIEAKGEGGSS